MRIIMFLVFVFGLLVMGYGLKMYFLIKKKRNKSDLSYLIITAVAVLIIIFSLTVHVRTKTYTSPDDDIYGIQAVGG